LLTGVRLVLQGDGRCWSCSETPHPSRDPALSGGGLPFAHPVPTGDGLLIQDESGLSLYAFAPDQRAGTSERAARVERLIPENQP
jgi:hypothetical protein